MAQVLTSEGLADFYSTGKVPEYTPPDKEVAKVEPEPVVVSAEADDGVEDENGLTAAERKAYSENVTKKISAKNRALKAEKAYAETQRRNAQAAADEATALKAELAELKKSSTPTDDGKGPARKDFASDADWWDAKIDWKAEQKAEAKFTALEAKRESDRIESEKLKRIEKFATSVDDYDEVVQSLAGKKQWQAVIDFMARSEMGPQLIYHFGQHPAEYDELAKMSAIDAVAELGEIRATLKAKSVKAQPKAEAGPDALETLKAPLSRAPAPLSALTDSATPVQKDPSKMSFEELRAYNRQERMRKASG